MSNKQIVCLFDRFYNIAIKDKIQDPLLHSQWNYFQSMLASTNFERDRINMYLSILEKEKKKKQGISQFQYNTTAYQPKLQKRYSQPTKQNQTLKQPTNFYTIQQQNIYQSDFLKNQKLATPKSKQNTRKIGVWDSKQKTLNSSNSKTKPVEEKPNYKKLYEAANNLIRIFQINVAD